MNTLAEACALWQPKSQLSHQVIHERFVQLVNETDYLNEHRTFVENHVWGFGERSFQWLWKLLVHEMDDYFSFMEIGVFKGQILSLIAMLADKQGKFEKIYGITPLSTIGNVWESDYKRDIEFIHEKFDLAKDYELIVEDSTSAAAIQKAYEFIPNKDLDILYIDGGHTYDIALSDISNYSPLVRSGGFVVIDDCCNDFPMPWGYFNGIEEVTKAVNKYFTGNQEYELIFSVVHIKVFRKK